MYGKIVLAYDGSQEGQKALIKCKEMALWRDAEIHLISVIPEILGYPIGEGIFIDTEYQEIQNKKSQQQQLENGVDLIKKEGIKCTGALLLGNYVKEISGYAARVSADLIVIGHKHLESVFERWWAESITSKLVEDSPCSVLIIVT